MKNVIFTICAKNYLAQAYVLAESIKKFEPETDFFIVVSDFDDEVVLVNDYVHLSPKILNTINLEDLAFKYNVIEFSTSIKPFFIEHFFINGYQNVIYLDPDMCIYDGLKSIYDNLCIYDFIITPHIRKPYIEFNGSTSEEEILFVGIYNLGFFAIKNCSLGSSFIEWWKAKLTNQCYADKMDALHVDQKWLDFLPSFYPTRVLIETSPTINMASWSIHEVIFEKKNDRYYVDNTPLLIYHFSGIDILDYDNINKKQAIYNLNNKPEYRSLFESYRKNVFKYNFVYYNSLNYLYDYFENGVFIDSYVRRIYRGIERVDKNRYSSLFGIELNSFYSSLMSNNLIIGARSNKYNRLKKSIKDPEKKIKYFEYLLKCLKHIIGIKYYYILVRLMSAYSRFENHMFLYNK